MELIPCSILILFGFLGNSYALFGSDSMSILDSASAVEFVEHKVAELRFSDLKSVVGLSAGYTPDTLGMFLFNGFKVKNPFKPIQCYHIIAFEGSHLPPSQSETQYGLLVDASIKDTFEDLGKDVKKKSLKGATVIEKEITITDDPQSLKQVHKLGDLGSYETSGPVITLISVKVDAKAKGKLVPQVEKIVRQISQDKCGPKERLVMSLRVDSDRKESFRSRRALAVDAVMATPSADLNLGTFYSGDYPVVFNIILFLAIVMLLFVVAVSVAMATMDPGRDSIIYRMTNPRMKKDQ